MTCIFQALPIFSVHKTFPHILRHWICPTAKCCLKKEKKLAGFKTNVEENFAILTIHYLELICA